VLYQLSYPVPLMFEKNEEKILFDGLDKKIEAQKLTPSFSRLCK
jgi:hypothetical protein